MMNSSQLKEEVYTSKFLISYQLGWIYDFDVGYTEVPRNLAQVNKRI